MKSFILPLLCPVLPNIMSYKTTRLMWKRCVCKLPKTTGMCSLDGLMNERA